MADKIHADARLTFDQAVRDSQAFANGLLELLGNDCSTRDLGTDSFGQRARMSSKVVLIALPNCVQYATVLFGTWKAGYTASLAGAAQTADELAWVLELARPAVVITTTNQQQTLQAAIRKQSGATQVKPRCLFVDVAADSYCGRPVHDEGDISDDDWKVLLRESDQELSAPNLCDADAAVILWSSGTSGRSKGVVLSHRALIASLVGLWHSDLQYGSEERWLAFVPFGHIMGLVTIFLLAPCCAATVHMLQPFNPYAMVDAVEKYQITAFNMAPPVASFLAKDPSLSRRQFISVKSVLSGGAPCPKEIIDAVYSKLGLRIRLVRSLEVV